MFIPLYIFIILAAYFLIEDFRKADKKIYAILILFLIFYVNFVPNLYRTEDEMITIYRAATYDNNIFFSPLNAKNYDSAPIELIVAEFFRFGFSIFGYDNKLPIKINMFFGLVAIYLMYILYSKIFKSNTNGLIAAVLVGVSPTFAHNATSAYTMPISITMILLALIFLVKANENKNKISYSFMMVFAFSLLPMIRIELGILMLPAFIFWARKRKITDYSVWLLTLLFISSYYSIISRAINEQYQGPHTYTIMNIFSTFLIDFVKKIQELPFSLIIMLTVVGFLIFNYIYYSKKSINRKIRDERYLISFLLISGCCLLIAYLSNSYFNERFIIPLMPFFIWIVSKPLTTICLNRKYRYAILIPLIAIFIFIYVNQFRNIPNYERFYLNTVVPELVQEHTENCTVIISSRFFLLPQNFKSLIEIDKFKEMDNCTYLLKDIYLNSNPNAFGLDHSKHFKDIMKNYNLEVIEKYSKNHLDYILYRLKSKKIQ